MQITGQNKTELIQENIALNMLIDITNAIANEHDLNLSLKHCLSIMCIGLNCPVGHIYFVSDATCEFLMPSDIFFLKNPIKTPAFHDLTKQTVVRYGEDIVGRVLSSGEPCIIENICQDKNFLRTKACQLDNLHGAMAFPVHANGKIIFVVEFFTHESKKRAEFSILFLNRLSLQISRCISNKYSSDVLKEKVVQLSYAVRSGKIGVWEYDPKNNKVIWDDQMHLIYEVIPQAFGGTFASWEATLHPEDKERTANEFKEAITLDNKFDTDFRIITPGGEIRYIHATALVKRRIDGKAVSVIGINTDITTEKKLLFDLSKKTEELEKINHLLKKHAYFDSLTGLMNRSSLEDSAIRILARCKRTKCTFAVLFIDVDDFKKINDSLGHSIGDLVLSEIALRLKKVSRKEDIIARIGGDEFIEIIELKNGLSATMQASRILNSFAKPIIVKKNTLQLHISIGIAYYPTHGHSFSELINCADIALLKAKNSGKNQLMVFADNEK